MEQGTLSTSDVATRLGVTEGTIYKYIKDKRLKPINEKKRWPRCTTV
ncbi:MULTISPECIES: helix-turn-helix domain-containing protein [unclassified Bacillus (in: firmicutes)]|nr:DNA binding domain-containing protein, excisionase family [Bacillus sp. UNCCL13]